jgi:hypothetical protein
MDYARAVAALYQAAHGEFVAERKRLAAELKAAGDRDGAKTLAKLGRPPISAWAVNQLYWHAREAFDRLMATAAQLREGDLSASAAHREALAKLRQRAAAILTEAGHNASEGTLRRTTLTLSALAALGTFAPDPAGALSDDRDPPGFEAAGFVATAERPAPMLSVAPPSVTPDEDADVPSDDGDAEPAEDHEISAEEREFAADLLRANAKPPRHLASVPGAPAPPAAPPKRARHLSAVPFPTSADDAEAAGKPDAVIGATTDVRMTDSNVRASDAAVRTADNKVRPADSKVRTPDTVTRNADDDDARIAAARRAAAETAERAERARIDEEKRVARERDRLATALRTAHGEVESRRRATDKLRAELARAEAGVKEAETIAADLSRALAALDD